MKLDTLVDSPVENQRIDKPFNGHPILHSNEVISLEEMLDDESDPPEPVVGEGVLLDGTLLLLYGQPKTGKSFMALNFALAIASGKGFASFVIPKARKVMYLSAEGGYYPTRKRVKKMCATHGNIGRGMLKFYVNPKLDLGDPESVKMLEEKLEKHKTEVLVIDPFARFHSVDENSANLILGILGVIRKLMDRHGLSVILVHHAGKSDSAGARGSSAIRGEYDSAIHLIKTETENRIEFDMRHVATPEPRDAALNPETFWFESRGEDLVVAVLKEHPDGLTRPELKKALMETGIKQSNAYDRINEACRRGAIKMVDGKRFGTN